MLFRPNLAKVSPLIDRREVVKRIHFRIERRKPRFPLLSQPFFLLIYIVICLGIFLIINLSRERMTDISSLKLAKEENIPPLPEAPPHPVLQKKEITIQKGQTISDILTEFGFSPQEIFSLRQQVKPTYDLARIIAGKKIKFYLNDQGQFHSFEYTIDDQQFLRVRKENESYQAKLLPLPYKIQVKTLFGQIEENLIDSINNQGENDLLALALAEIFAWDIDFYLDLRRGDTYKIIFEKKFLDGNFVNYGSILAAEFTNQGRTYQAFRYSYPDTGETDYFTYEGQSLRKEFLKSPIKFARITSRFSYNRLHPIRKVYRPHYGVDYAAKVGTPVQATAEGQVTFVGWNGGAGRMIRIRHKNGYETLYLHLRDFAPGIRRGAQVKGGQVIGYVGASGEATGPHLDYRIKYRGKYINPLAWRFKPVHPLRPEYLKNFQQKAQKYRFCFQITDFFSHFLTNALLLL